MIHEMDKGEEYGALAVFTALAPLSAGGLVGLLAAPSYRPQPGAIDWAAMVVLMTGVLALSVSLLHLGRPWRAPLALLKPGSSWLSREVILFGSFLIVLAFYSVSPAFYLGEPARRLIGLAGALIGLLGTLATGETYHLRSHPAWDQWLAVAAFPLGALSAGSLFGFFLSWQLGGRLEAASGCWMLAALFIAAALAVTWLRTMRSQPTSKENQLSRQLAQGSFRWLVALRLVAGLTALLFIGTGDGAQLLAWTPALLGEFADRLLFFKTAVPVSLRSRYLS